MALHDVKPLSLHLHYMTQRQKTALLNLRVAPELKEAAVRAAEADQRSLTSLIEKLLTDHLREKGFLAK